MRTTSALPLILTAIISFAGGLATLRLLHETSTIVGTTAFAHAPSWLGIDLARDSAVLSIGGGKNQDKQARDDRMEALVDNFGQTFFDKSVSYSGSNHRIRRILRRALAGEGIRLGVIGGSITAATGLPSGCSHLTYADHVSRWIEETFPNGNHSVKIIGLGGYGATYWANCFLEHIPEQLDLVLIDFAVNDRPTDEEHAAYDHLLRALLTLPSAPAVISFEFFQLSTQIAMRTGGSNELDSSRFLDVPALSLRNTLLPELLLHPSRIPDFFARGPIQRDGLVDPRHPGLRGHYAAGSIINHHLWKQLLYVEAHDTAKDAQLEELAVSRLGVVDPSEPLFDQMRKSTPEEFATWDDDRSYLTERNWGSRNEEIEFVPRLGLLERFHHNRSMHLPVPRCRSVATSGNTQTREKLIAIATTKGDRVENGTTHPGEGSGWFEWQSNPQKQYLISRSPKAQVTFDLTLGLVKLWYLRSWEYGLGDVSCWVDGRTYQKVRISGAWENRMNIGQIAEIATGLPSGAHQLHCVNEGNGEFRIVSVITG